jgi:hypothetical protein
VLKDNEKADRKFLFAAFGLAVYGSCHLPVMLAFKVAELDSLFCL